MLEPVALAMRARTFLFTTLLLLCHPQLWSQALTKQFPPAEESGSFPDDPSLQSTIPEAHVVPLPPEGVPVKIEADTQTYVRTDTGGLYTLSGHAVIHYKDYVVSADHVTYNQDTSDVVAEGNLHLDGGPDDSHFVATHGTMNLDRHTRHFYDVTGTMGVEQAPGKKMVFTSGNPFALTGRELIQTGPQTYQVIDGTITSCRLAKPDWQLVAHDFFLEDGKARAKNSVFELLRVPLFYLPYVTHPVNEGARDSGFLIPIIGSDTSKGLILGEEVYYVMGRSADLIVGSEYFSKRGFAPLGQFRFKGRGYNFATVRFHSLLDRQTGTQNQGGGFNRYESFESNQSSPNGEEEIRILHIPTLQFEGLDQSLGNSPLMWGANVTGTGLSRTEPGFQTSKLVPRFDLYPHLALPVHLGGWTLRPVVRSEER